MSSSFYCNFCGQEVKENDISCPKCHRIFTSIKCPKCGYKGKEGDFSSGCPKCGYLSSGSTEKAIPKTAKKKRNWFSTLSPFKTVLLLLGLFAVLALLYLLYTQL